MFELKKQSSDQSDSTLWTLAPELRKKIYELVLLAPNGHLGAPQNDDPGRELCVFDRSRTSPGKIYTFDVSLLVVCQAIYQEAQSVLYKINTFHFSIHPAARNDSRPSLSYTNTFHHIANHVIACDMLRTMTLSCWCDCFDASPIKLSIMGDATLACFIDALSSFCPALQRLDLFLLAINPLGGVGLLQTDPNIAPHTQKAFIRFVKNVRKPTLRIMAIADLDYDQQKDDVQTFLYGIASPEHWKEDLIEGHYWYGARKYPYIRDGAIANPGRLWKLGGSIWARKGTVPLLQDYEDAVGRKWNSALPAEEFSSGCLALIAHEYVYEDS